MLRAGKLNCWLRIEKKSLDMSPSGQPIKAPWELFDECWADVLVSNGRQFIAADRDTSAASVSVRVRYRTDIEAGMRVVYAGMAFEILAVLPDLARREHTDLACSVGVRA